MKKIYIILTIFLLIFSINVFAETKVKRIAIAKGIENREPVDVNTIFPADIGKVYCFTEITTDKYPTKVVHIWIYKDNIMAEVPLAVNSGRWRTYSSKKILPKWKGDWKVEIYSEDGKMIDSISFKIE
ncbi:DUF2914 domain-containing protein [Deferribacter thermophilus]|uniref:DUF2914 domain-containing protein n=1 Tax=Deferribacter thermophilus TaxID=53573 RepID=UPI003C2276B5